VYHASYLIIYIINKLGKSLLSFGVWKKRKRKSKKKQNHRYAADFFLVSNLNPNPNQLRLFSNPDAFTAFLSE
jgi:hypothetical protein